MSLKSVKVNYARAANKYVARGIRKWLVAGPLRKPVENAEKLDPNPGDMLGDEEWTAEMFIPWASISPPPSGRSLRAFFCRRHGASGDVTGVVQELSCPGLKERDGASTE